MTNRSFYEIIYDLLKALEGRECKTQILLLFKRAKIDSPYMRTKYLRILETSGLVTTTGHSLNSDIVEITFKGKQYISSYDVLERLLRSGLPDYPHPKFDPFPEHAWN